MNDSDFINNKLIFSNTYLTHKDLLKICKLILFKYHIKINLHKENPLKYNLYVNQTNLRALKKLVSPYKHKSKLYKLKF